MTNLTNPTIHKTSDLDKFRGWFPELSGVHKLVNNLQGVKSITIEFDDGTKFEWKEELP